MRTPSTRAVSLDVAVAHIAARRRGLITRQELLDLGLSSSAIGRRIAAGRLHPVHRGVYLVGHVAPLPLASEHAVLLACGPPSALSHHCAGFVLGMLQARRRSIDVSVPGSRHGPTGARVHRVAAFAGHEVLVRHGLRVTAPIRTLVDLAACDLGAFEHAFNEALVQRLVTVPQLRAAAETGRPGAARLRAALDAGPAPTRSELERHLLRLLARAGLPPPETNVRVNGHEVDALWTAQRLVVEVDGYSVHRTRRAFEHDRDRDADHLVAGYRVLRLTWRQVVDRPHTAVARIAAALALAVGSGPSATPASGALRDPRGRH